MRTILLGLIISMLGCTDARIASRNLSKAAEQFELTRRIVFYNGITGNYILVIQGLCSVAVEKGQLAVTCKVGKKSFKKHYLGLSDNVTYLSEQLTSSAASVSNYRIIFKPSVIIPDIEVK